MEWDEEVLDLKGKAKAYNLISTRLNINTSEHHSFAGQELDTMER